MNDSDIFRTAINMAGYIIITNVLIFVVRDLVRNFLRDWLSAIRADTHTKAKLYKRLEKLTGKDEEE